MVKSLRHAKAVAMAASFIETAVSLEKQARGIEALIEEQVSKAVEAVHEDAKKLQAVAKAYAAAAAEAAAAAPTFGRPRSGVSGHPLFCATRFLRTLPTQASFPLLHR